MHIAGINEHQGSTSELCLIQSFDSNVNMKGAVVCHKNYSLENIIGNLVSHAELDHFRLFFLHNNSSRALCKVFWLNTIKCISFALTGYDV